MQMIPNFRANKDVFTLNRRALFEEVFDRSANLIFVMVEPRTVSLGVYIRYGARTELRYRSLP